jgi:hypothetical protein
VIARTPCHPCIVAALPETNAGSDCQFFGIIARPACPARDIFEPTDGPRMGSTQIPLSSASQHGYKVDLYHLGSITFPSAHDLTILGKTGHHGHARLFGITPSDRLGHVWILRKTGMGKSTPLIRLIAEDLQAGRGLMLIDPRSDLVEAILDLVPPSRVADTIPFNPADMAYPLAFNPLARVPGIPAHLQAAGLFARLLPFSPSDYGTGVGKSDLLW